MRVAVLGTGIMGAPMARNLAAAGHEVSAWNRSREKAEPLAEHGVSVAGSVAEAVARRRRGGDDAGRRRGGRGGGRGGAGRDGRRGARADEHDRPGRHRAPGASAPRQAGVPFVDAPVSGTRQPAEQGKLLVLASGPEDVRERVDPVFDAVGARTVWLGEAGTAQRLKLVLNTWLLGLTEALAEAIALAEGLGVDPRTFLETIDGAPIGAPYAQLKGPMMIDGEFPPAFPLDLAAKDAGLALEAAEQAGLRLGALAAVGEQMRRASADGHGDKDMAATIHASRPA